MTILRRSVLVSAACAIGFPAATAAAQTPALAQAAQPKLAQPVEKAPAPPPPPAYTYEPEGRRDPFVSLLARGSDPTSAASRPPGVAGLLINEVIVKGIVRDRSGFIAMVQAPDNKTYIVRGGDKLMDGTVKSITADTVVFSQDVNDPLSLVKQREVRKAVRPLEDQRGGRG
jgi:type IV pilus assembly protein PilP